jgi:ribosomal protein S18 acetylase RimI-like enzyme
MTSGIQLGPLTDTGEVRAALSDLLIEVVANGGSVSFMHPLAPDTAADFWAKSLAAADAGKRVVLGATMAGELAGTVTLDLDAPQNQPHRADIAKLMTRVRRRGQGVARALMLEAERIALAEGRSLLTLDTAAEDGAAGLYEALGYAFAGTIPDYAYKPLGGLTATLIYFKRIGPAVGANQGSR